MTELLKRLALMVCLVFQNVGILVYACQFATGMGREVTVRLCWLDLSIALHG